MLVTKRGPLDASPGPRFFFAPHFLAWGSALPGQHGVSSLAAYCFALPLAFFRPSLRLLAELNLRSRVQRSFNLAIKEE